MNQDPQEHLARIRVAGVGGAGGNAINRMIAADLRYVDFIAMNTDAQALAQVKARRAIHIGQQLTRGLGAGGNPTQGARAAEESAQEIADALAGSDLVFVTLGLGGGTGTGAGPIVARIARRLGALVVGVVTLPFTFEGRQRMMAAHAGLQELREHVDTLVTIPNDRLFRTPIPNVTLQQAFHVADDILRQAVGGIAELMTVPGLINLDFADLRAVMADAGTAMMSIGEADGPDRARTATRFALTSPLLGLEVQGAQGFIFNVTGGSDITLSEIQTVAEAIGAVAHPDATIIFGAVTDEAFTGKLRVTVIATGLYNMRGIQPHAPTAALEPPASLISKVPTVALAKLNQYQQRPPVPPAASAPADPRVALPTEAPPHFTVENDSYDPFIISGPNVIPIRTISQPVQGSSVHTTAGVERAQPAYLRRTSQT